MRPSDRFHGTIGTMATQAGIDVTQPFVFVLEGQLVDVRVHIINGACPVHSRRKDLPIEEGKRPYELETDTGGGGAIGRQAVP